MTHPTPTPTIAPRTEAITEYTAPSTAKVRTRWLRLNPTARSMPSSVLRSSESITNRLTSSRIPAITLKKPTPRYSDPMLSPTALAWSRRDCLAFTTWTPGRPARRASIAAATSSVRVAPPNTPPPLETST